MLFNGQALCLILMGDSTAVFNGALSASPSFVLMGALSARSRGRVRTVLMEPLSATNV